MPDHPVGEPVTALRYHGSFNKRLESHGSECVWFSVCRRYTNCISNTFQQLNCVARRMQREQQRNLANDGW